MDILRDASLRDYNSFGLDYRAEMIVHVYNEEEAVHLLSHKENLKQPLLILAGGSNMLFTENYRGTIIHPRFRSVEIETVTNDSVIVSAGAGVVWDDFVQWCVEKGYGGIENLSLIPGLVGAAPVQNIGAYGQEAGDSIEYVNAIHISDGNLTRFSKEECRFGYRSSIFKKEKGKYLITKAGFRLQTTPVINLSYGSVKDEISAIGEVSLRNVRQAVINIRKSKLPDPALIGNAGSFFKNPVLPVPEAERLLKEYPQIPVYNDISGGKKLAAGWLIEKCGWKGKRIGDAGVHEKQALVLVNHGKATGKEIYELSELIRLSVFEKFGVELEREVEIIGST